MGRRTTSPTAEHLIAAALSPGTSKVYTSHLEALDRWLQREKRSYEVTEVATGHIVVVDSVSSSVKQGSAISVGGIRKAEASGDPFADVQEVVAAKIAEAIVTSRVPIKVIQVQSDGTLILNYGDVFFATGDRLAAFSVGETFVDPDTGEVLGAEETEIGVIEITRAEPRFSRARAVTGDVGQGSTLKRLVGTEASDQQTNKRKRSGARW